VHYAHAIFGIDTESGCIAVHPSDLAVALTAYDATVQLMASDGNRRAMPIRDFLKPAEADPTSETEAAPGELITAIDIPPQGGRSGDYVKMPAEGFAMASAATLMALRDGYVESVSIALGGVAHRPWRSSEAEAFMIGKEPSVKTFDLVATAFVNEAVTDEQTAFRRPLLKQVIMQSLDRAAAYWSRS
jgi:xanthine dehydrogenase YagS FAD-binding subunit